jgi:tetracycline resistance efflux pump
MLNSWVVLIPPLLVLSLAITTRRVLTSLFLGILSAALIVAQFSPLKTTQLLASRFWEQLVDSINLYSFGFLMVLGMLITLMNNSGGTDAYGRLIKKLIKTPRSVKFSSIILSMLFMIDDFFNSLTVGCIMRPLSDKFKIPRAKLAFLIDSLAAPLVVIMPISTWIATLLMQLNKAGISLDPADAPLIKADPFVVYLYSIPFVFYAFITLASVWFIVYHGVSFGLMKKHEYVAETTGNLFGGKPPIVLESEGSCAPQGTVWDFILPLGSLLLFVALAILYDGKSTLFGGINNLFATIQHANIFFALFAGGLIALLLNMIQMALRKRLNFNGFEKQIKGSWELMGGSMITLFLAWTFSSILKDDLQTGQYIAQLLIGALTPMLLPAIFFLASLATACSTGSSWSTIAVMTPIAIPLLVSFFNVTVPTNPELIPLLYPIVGAIFGGAAAGDHISPIATTTIMSATSAGSYLDDHAYTQLPYALPGVIAATLSYVVTALLLPYGLWISAGISLMIGIIIALSTLYILNARSKKSA